MRDFFSVALGVLASGVQHADNFNLVGQHTINHDVIGIHDQLVRAGNVAKAIQVRMLRQRQHGCFDGFLQTFRGDRVELGDIAGDGVEFVQRLRVLANRQHYADFDLRFAA